MLDLNNACQRLYTRVVRVTTAVLSYSVWTSAFTAASKRSIIKWLHLIIYITPYIVRQAIPVPLTAIIKYFEHTRTFTFLQCVVCHSLCCIVENSFDLLQLLSFRCTQRKSLVFYKIFASVFCFLSICSWHIRSVVVRSTTSFTL